jgi:predicted O-methyltransferase YrrM
MKPTLNDPWTGVHPDTRQVLDELYQSDTAVGSESVDPVPLDKGTRTSPEQGALLRRLVIASKARRTLEIGFAYGFSAIWILDGLRQTPGSQHFAVDPFERTAWAGIGIRAVERLSYAKSFQLIEDYSIHALSRLIKSGSSFDLVYIDGYHRFDDVLVDFYLADQALNVGGLLILDDMWMASVQRVVNFIRRNRAYDIVQTEVDNVCVMRKLASDTRNWDHYEEF